jgi:hypothetical protein
VQRAIGPLNCIEKILIIYFHAAGQVKKYTESHEWIELAENGKTG